jgi:arylsulfatase
MNRRDLLRNSLLSAGALGARAIPAEPAGPPAAKPTPRTSTEPMPNILWVCTDSQRFDTLQGLSNSVIRTPNLAKFMGESVTFTNTFVQTPICAPSRGSFLSGRYPHCTGLRANGLRIRADERLVTRTLADYGYECGLVGKLHLSPVADGRLENRIDDGYDVFEWSHDLTDSWPGQNKWRVWLAEQGVKLPPAPAKDGAWGMPLDPKYTQTAWCGEEANHFIRKQGLYGPWMMSVNIFQPHYPFWPTEEYLSHYDPAKMPLPAYREGELSNKSTFERTDHNGATGGRDLSFAKTSPADHQLNTAAYYAMIEQVDTAFGRMMQTLEETGQADNTIVVFMSDHGEMLGDHGIYYKGPYFYDCLTRVPLIIRWPGRFKAGLKVDALVEMIDLAPTLLEAVGIPATPGMQGQSLLGMLTGATTTHRDSVYMEYFDANMPFDVPPMLTGVRTEDWKLVFYDKPRCGELYDLKNDPGEFTNAWDDPHHRDAREQMLQLLVSRMIGTTDPLPIRHSSW